MNDENMRTFTIFSSNLTDLVADERLSRKDIAYMAAGWGYMNGHPGYGDEERIIIVALMESGLSIGKAIDTLEPVISKRTVL
jgi:hypothetical protein